MSNQRFVQTRESYDIEFPPMKSNYELEGEAEGSVPVLGAGVRVQVPQQDDSMAQVNISEYI